MKRDVGALIKGYDNQVKESQCDRLNRWYKKEASVLWYDYYLGKISKRQKWSRNKPFMTG